MHESVGMEFIFLICQEKEHISYGWRQYGNWLNCNKIEWIFSETEWKLLNELNH